MPAADGSRPGGGCRYAKTAAGTCVPTAVFYLAAAAAVAAEGVAAAGAVVVAAAAAAAEEQDDDNDVFQPMTIHRFTTCQRDSSSSQPALTVPEPVSA